MALPNLCQPLSEIVAIFYLNFNVLTPVTFAYFLPFSIVDEG